MIFPNISQIATQQVELISLNATIYEAIDLMHKSDHRAVIVYDGLNYSLLATNELIRLKIQSYDFDKKIDTLNLPIIPTVNKNQNILETLIFLNEIVEYICVIDDNGKLCGLLTHSDIVSHIDPETLMENYRIGDLLNINKEIKKLDKNEPTQKALSLIMDHAYESTLVMDNNIPIGILTTKDAMDLLYSKKDLDVPVSTYMTSPIETISHLASIKEAIRFMQDRHFKRIVVVQDSGELSGIILQKELIALSYNKWSSLMKNYQKELTEINNLLEKKSKKYEKIAGTDPLTGLYNRYKFTELFISEFKTMIQRANSMSILFIDIDYFKKINDSYGHNSGDHVLVDVANILLRELRAVDILSRWGGEEFIALLPTANASQAKKIAINMKDKISEKPLSDGIKTTISIGVSEVQNSDTLESVVKRADEALYKAKQDGRNCVRVK